MLTELRSLDVVQCQFFQDRGHKGSVTIKDPSMLKIQRVADGNVMLPRGRDCNMES